MRFSVINLGCKVNRVESDSFISSLIGKGFEYVGADKAEVILINTCTVTGEADKKTRKAIRKALRGNKTALVVVTGCAVVIDAEGLQSFDDRIITIADKSKITERIVELFEARGKASPDKIKRLGKAADKDHSTEAAFLRMGNVFPSRVGIKIQDGCCNACTYCIVHEARGKPWSRDHNQILEEVALYENQGVDEVVLTGINLGSYRSDKGGLADLLTFLLCHTSRVRFRISSIEPCDVDDELVEVLSSSHGRICRHLHLPLQSGSSKVLKEMARPYDAESFRNLSKRLYAAVPSLSLSTDVIVGFPGETEEDFEMTLEMVAFCKFSKVHVFPYSQRADTPAAKRIDQISDQVKRNRSEVLRELADNLRENDYSRRCGQAEEVLVEGDGLATTESYHRIQIHDKVEPGKRYLVTLTKDLYIG